MIIPRGPDIGALGVVIHRQWRRLKSWSAANAEV
ncbi:hypothetical protein DES45_10318 [Microvirga subterranea]|uniref:Uncharacterized protein n=1 Tax=Microvirga subterranea TaxID=186651 RepID=A0A370HMV5_9HYPH|nr:hypothetical protein DES45_10318 [Microvirga subterranea]